MVPRSTCPMLTRCGVTSIEALCQVAHSFERLDLCNHTLYRLVAFREMAHFFAIITLVVSIFSFPPMMPRVFTATIIDGLFSTIQLCFHHNAIYQVCSSSSTFIFAAFFFPITECISIAISIYVAHKLLSKSILCQFGCGFRVYFCFSLALYQVLQHSWAQAISLPKAMKQSRCDLLNKSCVRPFRVRHLFKASHADYLVFLPRKCLFGPLFHMQIWIEVGSHPQVVELNMARLSCPSLVVP